LLENTSTVINNHTFVLNFNFQRKIPWKLLLGARLAGQYKCVELSTNGGGGGGGSSK
jgi:hypothetical protein